MCGRLHVPYVALEKSLSLYLQNDLCNFVAWKLLDLCCNTWRSLHVRSYGKKATSFRDSTPSDISESSLTYTYSLFYSMFKRNYYII